jgi:hypothetical protein
MEQVNRAISQSNSNHTWTFISVSCPFKINEQHISLLFHLSGNDSCVGLNRDSWFVANVAAAVQSAFAQFRLVDAAVSPFALV